MRRGVGFGAILTGVAVLAALAGGQASGAPTAASSDIYITGKVLGRVAGKNAALVEIKWAYKCLGDKLGAATYDWTLTVVRRQPLPEKTTTLGRGTSKFGTKTVRLAPGQYLPISDPYTCETERGAGYDQPEIGAPFTVPDYCSWTVASIRGLVQLEHGGAVKAAKSGSILTPGDALVTPKGGKVALRSAVKEGTAALAGGSRLELDAKHCASNGGWKFRLDAGRVTATATSSASAKSSFMSVTRNATVTGFRGSRWDVLFAAGTTKVKALAGRVRVSGKTGATVLLKAGRSVTVRGAQPPR